MSPLILLVVGSVLVDCWIDERGLFLDDPRTPEIADVRAKGVRAPIEPVDVLESAAPPPFFSAEPPFLRERAAAPPRPLPRSPSAWLAWRHSRSPT